MKNILQKTFAILLVFLTLTTGFLARAEDSPSSAPKLNEQQLDELVGKIALYPDPLLAQILPASTYPLEVVQAARVIQNEKDFDKIDKQDWDPSVKAIAYYPTVTKMMNDDLAWTQQLGSAVVTQQEDVMASIQRLRKRAQEAGNLQTTKEQIVNASPTTIEIVPATPEIIYVPVYNPAVVYVVPVVRPRIPFISFISWRIGRWLDVGFYWPSYSIYYSGPTWWYGDWHRHYHHHHHVGHTNVRNVTNVTNVTNITNIYNVKNVKNVWHHNPKRVVTHQHANKYMARNNQNKSYNHANNNKGNNRHQNNTVDQKSKRDNNSLGKSKIAKNDVTKKQNDNLDNFKKQMKPSHNFTESKKNDSPKHNVANQPKPQHDVKTSAKENNSQETVGSSKSGKDHSKSPQLKRDRQTAHEHKNTFSQQQPQKNVSKNISRNSGGRGSSTQFNGSSKSRGRN